MAGFLDGADSSFGLKPYLGTVAPRETWVENTLMKNDKDGGTSGRKGENNVYPNRVKVRLVTLHDQIEDDNDLPFATVMGNPFMSTGQGNSWPSHMLEGGESVIVYATDMGEDQKFIVSDVFLSSQSSVDLNSDVKSNSYTRPFLMNSKDYQEYRNVVNNLSLANENVEGFSLGTNQSITGIDFSQFDGVFDPATMRSMDVSLPFTTGSGVRLTNAHKRYDSLLDKETVKPTCKDDNLIAGITSALSEFSKLLINVEKYNNFYVNSLTGLLVNLDGEIDLIAKKIGGLMTAQVSSIRNSIFSTVEKRINSFINQLIPEELKPEFGEGMKGIMSTIYCLFENILGGLKNTVKNFLKALVGKFLNAPLCAAEQFLGTLLGDVMGGITDTISPILSSLTSTLGGALGSVNSLINKALAGVGLLYSFIGCDEFKCPLPSKFDNKLGPSQQEKDNIAKITERMSSISSGIGGLNLPSVFQKTDGDPSTVAALVGECESNLLRCGPPIVEIFGGSGVGGAANAVVSEIGEIIGADVVDRGLGYQEKPPYVTFRDACGDGNAARGKAIINPDDGGIDRIIIESPGYGYNNTFNRIITTSGIVETDVINETANSNSASVTGQIDDVVVVNPGFGYSKSDTIEVDGAELRPVILGGRVVDVEVINPGNGFTSIPDITINTKTGIGANFVSVLKFTPISEISEVLDPTQVISVIDCIDKPLSRKKVGE